MDTYVEDDGPVCTVCERRVCRLETTQPACCKICASGTIATLVFQEQMVESPDALYRAFVETVQRRTSGQQTLVFLTARKYGKNDRLDVGIFEDLWRSLIQNQINPGRFGGTNRPGYPQPMKLMAKCASASSARAPLDMMHERTQDQPEDVLTLNMLADIIQCCYRPGDIIIIGMRDPTNFCVGHRDVESFISEMISRGIPKSSFFFYYDSLAIENGTVQKNEAVVLASDLRGAILKKLPRYGMGPGRIDNTAATLSAVLYAMEQGRIHDRDITVPPLQQQPPH